MKKKMGGITLNVFHILNVKQLNKEKMNMDNLKH